MSMNKRSPKDDSDDGEVSSTSCTQRTALAKRFYKSKKVAEKWRNLTSVSNTEENH